MEKDVCTEEKENVDSPPDLIKESGTGPATYRYTKVYTFIMTTVAVRDLVSQYASNGLYFVFVCYLL